MENYIKQLESENEELRQKLAVSQCKLHEQEQLNKIDIRWSGPSMITGNSISYYLYFGKMIVAQINEVNGFFTGQCNGYNIATCSTLEEAKDALMKVGQPFTDDNFKLIE